METTTIFTGATAALIAWVVLGLLMIRFITPVERRLVAGTALLLAGLFLLARRDASPAMFAGAGGMLAGLAIVLRAAVEARKTAPSRAAPIAVIVVLPAAFLGAILLIGVIVSAAAAPVRLVSRLVVGG